MVYIIQYLYIDGEGVYFNDYFNWKNIPQFTKLVFESPAAHIASQLMDSRYRYVKTIFQLKVPDFI